MARLLLNYDAIRNSCVKNLNEAIAKLDSAVSIFNSLSIPYDYRKRQNIINIKNSIIKRRKELVDIRNWIMNSNNDFTTITNEFCGRADRLPRSRFGVRKGL